MNRTDIADCPARALARVRGRIVAVQIEPHDAAPRLVARVEDGTGRLDAVFMGRRTIPGIEPGAVVELEGRVCASSSLPRVFNPGYTLVAPA